MNTQDSAPRTRWIVVTAVVVGLVLLAGTVAGAVTAAVYTVRAGGDRVNTSHEVSIPGIDGVDINASAADFSVVFDVEPGEDIAVLEVRDSAREWVMQLDGDTLEVDAKQTFGFSWLRFGPSPNATVVLHLPADLREEALDADLDLSSGFLSFDGTFGELQASVSAGAMLLSGPAESLDAKVSAGQIDFDLADVRDAEVQVSAGDVVGELTGEAPRSTELRVSAGSIVLTLPDTRYDVDSHVSAGSLENNLRTDANSRNSIEVRVSAGETVLEPGRR